MYYHEIVPRLLRPRLCRCDRGDANFAVHGTRQGVRDRQTDRMFPAVLQTVLRVKRYARLKSMTLCYILWKFAGSGPPLPLSFLIWYVFADSSCATVRIGV